MNHARVKADTVVVGSTLVPKRGRQHDYDPLTITQVWRSDKRAQVHDTAVLLGSQSWRANGRVSRDGSKVVTLRELAQNYWALQPTPGNASEAVAQAETALGRNNMEVAA